MSSIVAVDIETTGLDSENDAIIEIGCVRFNARRVEDEWTTLVNPGRPIPPFITNLTGITDQMVREAPTMRAIAAELKDFIGECPVLGHNVRFDLSFLRKYGMLSLNDTLDTYELASVLLPTASRYNLGALAQLLEIPLPASHRALDDARVTRVAYQHLYEEALHLPLPILAEITRLGEPIDWNGYTVFREAYQARAKEGITARQVSQDEYGPIFEEVNRRDYQPLKPNPEFYALNPEEVASILEWGGAFSQHFPQYEHRPQQVEMLRAVTSALCDGGQLMVEAGTGTGKSMAYLIPSALWALQNNSRVVVSTNTINLQDQLIHKDIPDLRAALGVDLRATLLKGRSNYLCPRRFANLRNRGPATADEMRVLGKILVWLQHSKTGDRGEINLNGPGEREAWNRVSAEDEGCSTENCMKRTGGVCPFYRAHLAAQSSHILIVNHALLLADVATDNKVLPEYQYLIVDEAHHLEDATTNALSFELTQNDVERLLRELGGPKHGALGWTLSTLSNLLSPSDYATVDYIVNRTTDLAFEFDNLARHFFETLHQFMLDQHEDRPQSQYAYQERILPATRSQPAWGSVELSWDEALRVFKPMHENIGQLIKIVANLIDEIPAEHEDLYGSLSNIYRRFGEMNDNLEALVFKPATDRVYWIEVNPNGRRLSLHAAPLHIGSLMDRYLWQEKASVVMTSATLTTAGDFSYLRGRLSAVNADELALGSPFDYENAALLYLVNDIPEPSDRNGHQRSLERGLVQLTRATGGRTLVLFTSYDQLRRTALNIRKDLENDEIQVYSQGEGASPHSLLEDFRSTDRAVLLGTRAFWEGVDVPGEALSILVIAKLPFDVPTDPIVAARAETFEDPFNQYSLPEAILRFRQGFGRLIRTQSDRGVVAVFDPRIIRKPYGKAFLASLPDCTVRQGPMAGLPRAAAQWLNL